MKKTKAKANTNAIDELVNKGGKLQKRIDQLEEKLKPIKDELREIAKQTKAKSLGGSVFLAVINVPKKTILKSVVLAEWIEENEQLLVWDCFKVSLSEARKTYGTKTIQTLATVIDDTPRITFVEV